MDAIDAVLRDLYTFAVKDHFGWRGVSVANATSEQAPTQTNPPAGKSEGVFSPHSTARLYDARQSGTEEVASVTAVTYAARPDTLLYTLPTRTFDGVILRVPFGASFRVIKTEGKWFQVAYRDLVGYVYEDDLSYSQAELTPHFSVGERYQADHPTTITLRTLIDDAFHAAPLSLPLCDVEYVTYRLEKHGQTIKWPPVRPRIAGTWQRILKGVVGVHLSVHPKKDAVMEYIHEDNTGHIAYVESVYPNESITISEIGYPEEGQFCERTLSKEEWKELRPVFIEVA